MIAGLDVAVVGFDEAAGDGQAQAGAGFLRRRRGPVHRQPIVGDRRQLGADPGTRARRSTEATLSTSSRGLKGFGDVVVRAQTEDSVLLLTQGSEHDGRHRAGGS